MVSALFSFFSRLHLSTTGLILSLINKHRVKTYVDLKIFEVIYHYLSGNCGYNDKISTAYQIKTTAEKSLKFQAVEFYRRILQAFCRKLLESQAILQNFLH